MTGPAQQTRDLIVMIQTTIRRRGIPMTVRELHEALGVSEQRIRSALQWACRGSRPDVEHICLANGPCLFAVDRISLPVSPEARGG